MTWDQYWYGDPQMVRAFREAHNLRNRQRNMEAWLQGIYILDAVRSSAPFPVAFAKKGAKPDSYPKSPRKLFGEETEKSEEEKKREAENERLKSILFFRSWARAVQQDMEAKGGDPIGGEH